MTTPRLAIAIEAEEGRRLEAYPDPLTGADPWTIGVGHTGPEVHPGLEWTDAQASAVLQIDIARAKAALDRQLPWWGLLEDPRQDVLVQMAFQMGIRGLLGFHGMLRALQLRDWAGAAEHMRDSLWARQTPARAERLARIITTGDYPK